MTGSCACARSSTRTLRRSALKRSAMVLTSAMKNRNSRRVRTGRREQLQAGPSARSRTAKGRNRVLPEDARVQEGTSPGVQGCNSKGRWSDKHKQGEVNSKYRSRLVAKEFKRYIDPDFSRQLSPQTC